MEVEIIKSNIIALLLTIYGVESISHETICELMVQTHNELNNLEKFSKIGLDKMTPKKIIKDKYSRIKCVNGHNLPVVVKKNKMPHCPFCGQALDWNE